MIIPYKLPGRRTSWCCDESGLSAQQDPDTELYNFRSINLYLNELGNGPFNRFRESSQEHTVFIPWCIEMNQDHLLD